MQCAGTGLSRARISDGRVLATLQGFAQMHDDAGYPSERGMLQIALGAKPPAATLASLESRGLIRSVTHPPETTPHWELTKAGHTEAAALSGEPETRQHTK